MRYVFRVAIGMVGCLVLVCAVVVWAGRAGAAAEAGAASNSAAIDAVSGTQIRALKVTILSTMLADEGIGEWGFAALVEADGRRVLVDTGARPQTVLQNARELNVDLSAVKEVVLTHNHSDHVGGLMTLRKELMKTNASALSRAHVAKGIFYSRLSEKGAEQNEMVGMQKEYEATGGTFIEHDSAAEIFPGAWLTGPVPREFPERNWSVTGKVRTPAGLVEDTIPEDQSLVLNTPQGLVLISGCGHAGVINTITFTRAAFAKAPVFAILGGFHLFAASDAQLDWTADKLKEAGVAYVLGAHCTGIESVYRIRQRLGLPRRAAVVGAVGATFVLGEGIHPGRIAQ